MTRRQSIKRAKLQTWAPSARRSHWSMRRPSTALEAGTVRSRVPRTELVEIREIRSGRSGTRQMRLSETFDGWVGAGGRARRAGGSAGSEGRWRGGGSGVERARHRGYRVGYQAKPTPPGDRARHHLAQEGHLHQVHSRREGRVRFRRAGLRCSPEHPDPALQRVHVPSSPGL